MTRDSYTGILDRLVAMLRRKPMTARAVATALRCSRPVAYERLRALKKREGARACYTVKVRESATGPQSTAYGVR